MAACLQEPLLCPSSICWAFCLLVSFFPLDPLSLPFQHTYIPLCQSLIPRNATLSPQWPQVLSTWIGTFHHPSVLPLCSVQTYSDRVRLDSAFLQQPACWSLSSHPHSVHWECHLLLQTQNPRLIPASPDLFFVLLQPSCRSPSSHHGSTSWGLHLLVWTEALQVFSTAPLSLPSQPTPIPSATHGPGKAFSTKVSTAPTFASDPERATETEEQNTHPTKIRLDVNTQKQPDAQIPVKRHKHEQPRQYAFTRTQ